LTAGAISTLVSIGTAHLPSRIVANEREVVAAIDTETEVAPAYQRGAPMGPVAGLYKAQIEPHWLPDSTRFWYVNKLRGDTREFLYVDAEAGTRKAAFDHARLAAALSKAAGASYVADKLPFDAIQFDDAVKAVRFNVGDATWQCDLSSYRCTRVARGLDVPADVSPPIAPDEPSVGEELTLVAAPSAPQAGGRRGGRPGEEITPETPANGTDLAKAPPFFLDSKSPDGRWTAVIKDFNVAVRGQDGQEAQLTGDGIANRPYGMLSWSPDSKTVLASRIDPAEHKDVYRIESSPRGGGRAKLYSMKYPLPGDKYTSYEPYVIDVASRRL
jgi:hypothetical protein